MSKQLNIVWFKRDLRIEDHRPLALAAQRGAVLPLYIVEPRLWAEPDTSARQWAFVKECLGELQQSLALLGQPLCVMVGDATSIFERIHAQHGIANLWSHEETGNGWTFARDQAVAGWAQRAGVAWHESRQFGVIRRLKSRDGWANSWDRDMAQPITPPPCALEPIRGDWPTYIPTVAGLGLAHDICRFRQHGGRVAALANLNSFLNDRGLAYRSRMSSPVTAFEACSRLSPHLSWGTVSMREVYQATLRRLDELRERDDAATRSWRGSLTSFLGRQHWHCHFMQKLEDEPRLEFENLHHGYDGLRPDIADPVRLAAWTKGETGFPFVDACMRALHQHGWINFRMRAMLMSFASYHLWLPWRSSGLHLARQFVDYEPGIHWSQVQMQSGTTGINTMRVYNPVKQGFDQDPTGAFVRTYVPELSSVPDAFIHEPWLWLRAPMSTYPTRIVDHELTAKTAREAISNIRKRSSHAETSRSIVNKHGSRKAGIPMTGRRKSKNETDKDIDQLKLDF